MIPTGFGSVVVDLPEWLVKSGFSRLMKGFLRNCSGSVHPCGGANDWFGWCGVPPLVFNGADHLADAWLDFCSPACAVEHTIVPYSWLDIVEVLIVRHIDAEIVRGPCLTQSANIILFAFDCHDGCVADR